MKANNFVKAIDKESDKTIKEEENKKDKNN